MRFLSSLLASGVALDFVLGDRRVRTALSGQAACGALGGACLAAMLALVGLFTVLFGDVWPKMLTRGEAAIRAEYEDHIARLKHRVDELASRNALDRLTIEGAMKDLVARQARLETRQAALARLAEEFGPTSAQQRRADAPTGNRTASVDSVRARLDALETRQTELLAAVTAETSARIERKTRTLAELRLPRSVLPLPAGRPGIGGPHVPVRDFDLLHGAALSALAERKRLADLVRLMPLGRPVEGDPEVSSGFGVRTDPFTRRPAMHEGLDLRLEPGVPVRATGAGRVTTAGHSGSGYGLMVEVEHGSGLSTVYGHLSAIRVREGDMVEPGAVVGLSGNTGRSTGPHLHYETRIDGDAVDPLRFLRVGEKLRRL